jgi:hypothetical protein
VLLARLQAYLESATGHPVELVTRRTYQEITGAPRFRPARRRLDLRVPVRPLPRPAGPRRRPTLAGRTALPRLPRRARNPGF